MVQQPETGGKKKKEEEEEETKNKLGSNWKALCHLIIIQTWGEVADQHIYHQTVEYDPLAASIV